MSLGITWYSLEDAASKYSLDKSLILKWIEEGLVRSDQDDMNGIMVHNDDIKLKVREMTGI